MNVLRSTSSGKVLLHDSLGSSMFASVLKAHVCAGRGRLHLWCFTGQRQHKDRVVSGAISWNCFGQEPLKAFCSPFKNQVVKQKYTTSAINHFKNRHVHFLKSCKLNSNN